MPDVLMIGVVLWAGLIMMAAGLTVMQWRRSGRQHSMPVRERRAVVAGPADAGTVMHLPGRHPEIVRPGRRSYVPIEPGPASESQASGVADAERGSHRPGAEPDQRQAGAEELTASERIARFYQEADQPVADFLMALGWTQERRTQDSG